ncbi:pilin [Miltoncostaea oceani]|uniref:pilin n=1 Tax=Miltoncostaea oceani TaxID=2843216 RepID=UPI001C3D033E|nr:pilin [Miltoncostaea oceani]
MSTRNLNAQVGLQLRLLDRLADSDSGVSNSSTRRRLTLASAGGAGALLLAPALAAAQAPAAPGGATGGCSAGGASTDGLTKLIQQGANFLIIIGGAFAVLMFAIGGFMIMGLGGTRKSKKGMDIVKNALIGLAIMVAGLFVREVLVKFIAGATGAGKNSADCLNNDVFGNPNRP